MSLSGGFDIYGKLTIEGKNGPVITCRLAEFPACCGARILCSFTATRYAVDFPPEEIYNTILKELSAYRQRYRLPRKIVMADNVAYLSRHVSLIGFAKHVNALEGTIVGNSVHQDQTQIQVFEFDLP